VCGGKPQNNLLTCLFVFVVFFRAVFFDASSHSCRMLLLIEMVSRAVKVLCRKRLRQLMETLTYPLEQPYVEETVLLLNSVFGGDEKVWQTQILPYIAEYFGVSFGGVKPMHPSKAGRMDTGNDNNAEKSNLDVYEDLGSSQGLSVVFGCIRKETNCSSLQQRVRICCCSSVSFAPFFFVVCSRCG
jgi:hypothetical protein